MNANFMIVLQIPSGFFPPLLFTYPLLFLHSSYSAKQG